MSRLDNIGALDDEPMKTVLSLLFATELADDKAPAEHDDNDAVADEAECMTVDAELSRSFLRCAGCVAAAGVDEPTAADLSLGVLSPLPPLRSAWPNCTYCRAAALSSLPSTSPPLASNAFDFAAMDVTTAGGKSCAADGITVDTGGEDASLGCCFCTV